MAIRKVRELIYSARILLFIDPDTDVLEFNVGALAMVLKGDPSLGGGILFVMIRKLGKDHAVNLLNQSGTLGNDNEIVPTVLLVGGLHFIRIRHFLYALGSILGINCFFSSKGQFASIFLWCLGVVPQAHLSLRGNFHLIPA